jgi:hypothetical protein
LGLDGVHIRRVEAEKNEMTRRGVGRVKRSEAREKDDCVHRFSLLCCKEHSLLLGTLSFRPLSKSKPTIITIYSFVIVSYLMLLRCLVLPYDEKARNRIAKGVDVKCLPWWASGLIQQRFYS